MQFHKIIYGLDCINLSSKFNVAITKIYLGIRQEELLETYDLLDF